MHTEESARVYGMQGDDVDAVAFGEMKWLVNSIVYGDLLGSGSAETVSGNA